MSICNSYVYKQNHKSQKLNTHLFPYHMQCHQVRPHIVSLNKHDLTQCAPEIDWARLIDHFWKTPTEKFSYHASHVSPQTLSPQSCPPPSDCRSGTWVVTGVGWWRVPNCSPKQLNSNLRYWQILTRMEPFDKPCCGPSDKISSLFGKNPNSGGMRPSALLLKKKSHMQVTPGQ